MKKIFLIAIICTFIFAGTGYFWRFHKPVKDEELPTCKMIQELEMILDKAPYEIEDYKSDVFDCSNECALLHDFLTAKGYNCAIVLGVTFSWSWFSIGFHSWLIAEKDGKKLWVESTFKTVAYQGYFRNYIELAHFRSLNLLQMLAKIFFFPNEWTY